jgi:hypothetical protein
LDKPYRHLQHPPVDYAPMSTTDQVFPTRNDTLSLIRMQSPVKDQGYRGTCSIFSATALFEAMLVVNHLAPPEVDLSEEWLQYLTTQTTSEEGSESPDNFKLLRAWGQPSEAALPYGQMAWTSKRQGLPAKRCGHLKRSTELRSCLTSHRDPVLLKLKDQELLDPNSVNYDPEFLHARQESLRNRDAYLLLNAEKDGIVTRVSEVQELLYRGIPLTLDLDFFYGAWSYAGGRKYGIQASPTLWKQGVVTYPEKGSNDRAKRDGGGHSVVVVGYDTEREVSYWVKMRDGKRKKFTRRGVYYFKNSWGPTDWGRDFEIDGVKMPGYGMILMDNAHEFGQFFRLAL